MSDHDQLDTIQRGVERVERKVDDALAQLDAHTLRLDALEQLSSATTARVDVVEHRAANVLHAAELEELIAGVVGRLLDERELTADAAAMRELRQRYGPHLDDKLARYASGARSLASVALAVGRYLAVALVAYLLARYGIGGS